MIAELEQFMVLMVEWMQSMAVITLHLRRKKSSFSSLHVFWIVILFLKFHDFNFFCHQIFKLNQIIQI